MIGKISKTYAQEQREKILLDAPLALTRKQTDELYKLGFAHAIDYMYELVRQYKEVDKDMLDIVCNEWDLNDFTMRYYLQLVKKRMWHESAE